AASAPYTWTIPLNETTTVEGKINITHTANNQTYNESAGLFKIKGSLDLTAPSNPGIVLTYNGTSTYNITWLTYGSIPGVRLKYSTNNGTSWPYTINNTTGANYTWPIPDAIGYNVSVKVEDMNDTGVNDTSQNTFAIKGSIILLQPSNGTESWVNGSVQQIQWKTIGTYSQVLKLQYCNNSSDPVWIDIPDEPAPGADNATMIYNWTIPDDITAKAKVKISTQEGNASIDVNDTSDNAFKIKGGITVTQPNTNVTWYVGQQKQINWTSTGTVTPVIIRYSTTNGSPWYTINASVTATAGLNSYNWTVNDTIRSAQCLINISDARTNFTSEVFDASDVVFNIYPQINVTAPIGGQNVSAHSNNTLINWTTTGSTITNVNIEYTTTGGAPWSWVQNETEANATDIPTGPTGTYLWMVPTLLCNDNAKIRVTDAADSNVSGATSKFNIVGSIDITTPNGGEEWTVGANKTIYWKQYPNIYVNISYSTDAGGSTWTPIIDEYNYIGSDASFPWLIGNDTITSNTTRIAIKHSSNPNVVNDTSSAPFAILGWFDITAPENGDPVIAEEPYTITWNNNSVGVSNVTLEYSSENPPANWSYV
ncbi:MAG: hypothetical protein Q8Q85_12440, partial [Gemmatimonadales bacterium]|nr:hypothetical protein [Gemmatimonadales bacterium]